ncbi:MAG: hypothetical protein D6748_06745 [Calditrichaeota bacterium]|nr:MAG: hypothetical protein D6748_06745 [Calditrichota bacterium]
MTNNQDISTNIFPSIYERSLRYFSKWLGASRTTHLAQEAYEKIVDYFPNLQMIFSLKEETLQVSPQPVDEKRLIAFAVWLQQFVKLCKQNLVGIGEPDIMEITDPLKDVLESNGFYQFYQDAQELEY